MPRYYVTVAFDARKTIVVDAPSEDEAEAVAFDIVGNPCLCHHCSKEIDLGDPTGDTDIEELPPNE